MSTATKKAPSPSFARGGGRRGVIVDGPDGRLYHSHDGLAPHSHEPIYSPGFFSKRAPPLTTRDFRERAFTVGIGGPVGTGKDEPGGVVSVTVIARWMMGKTMGQKDLPTISCNGWGLGFESEEVSRILFTLQLWFHFYMYPKLVLKNTYILLEVADVYEILLQITRDIVYYSLFHSYKKTALMLALCQLLRDKYSLAAVTNDIFTKEDGEFLVKHGALPEERIRAVETGGCPHAAIREDISINLGPLEELSNLYKTDILLCESGGDNLAANFSRELADYIIYIIDVSGGDKIPRKGGPGITQADLLVINKTDLAPAVGADLSVMEKDALRMRDGGPFVFAQVKHGFGVQEIVGHILHAWEVATGNQRH